LYPGKCIMIFSVHRVLLRLLFRIRHAVRRLAMPQLIIALLLIGTSFLTLSGDIAPLPVLAAPHASQSASSTTSGSVANSVSTVTVAQETASTSSSTSNIPIISTGQPLLSITPSPGITPLIPPTSTSQTTSATTPASTATPTGSAQTGATPLAATATTSQLIFGTNMSLFDAHDQVLTSAPTRTLLIQMGTPIIRMPLRSSLSDAVEEQAAQAIKQIGATPLVILRGAVDSNVLADDTRAINYINTIFGNNTVYYEYGNEEDLAGVKVSQYIASWNSVIPQLQRLAPNGRFIGPVNFQYDANYLRAFLQEANPRPAAVSWHEYTCDVSWAQDVCISHIDNWTKHVSDARAVMNATIKTTLPIMITEWNYAPNATANDGKNNDRSFMTTWTTKALQTLAANNIYAAMQYSVTNTAIPLIDSNNALTTQGSVFQALHHQLMTQGNMTTPIPLPTTAVTPTAVPTATATATPTPSPTAAPSPTATATPSPVVTPSPTATPTPSPVVTPSPSPTATPLPTATPTAKPSPTATPTPTVTPTHVATPSPTASPEATPSPAETPSSTETATPSPTITPTVTPESTVTPTTTPDSSPTATPEGTVTPTPTKTGGKAGTPTVTPSSTATPQPETPTPSTSQVLNVL
jgi:hypothetical protein